jgi:hypothetical protein
MAPSEPPLSQGRVKTCAILKDRELCLIAATSRSTQREWARAACVDGMSGAILTLVPVQPWFGECPVVTSLLGNSKSSRSGAHLCSS